MYTHTKKIELTDNHKKLMIIILFHHSNVRGKLLYFYTIKKKFNQKLGHFLTVPMIYFK